MNIKNYTSKVEVTASSAKIEDMLVQIGCKDISRKYNDQNLLSCIRFLYFDADLKQTIAFNLTIDIDSVFQVLWKEVKRPREDTKANTMKQANMTAWKILCDWCEMQCTMILLGRAKPLQMFLAYAYDVDSDQTFYDKIKTGKIKMLSAPKN